MRPLQALPQAVVTALEAITQGKPFPWVILLPQWEQQTPIWVLRTVAYNWLQANLTLACPAHQARLCPDRGRLCLLNQEGRQLICDCQLQAHSGGSHPLGERLWQKMSAADKLNVFQAHPQRPGVSENFWLIEARIERIELGEAQVFVCSSG